MHLLGSIVVPWPKPEVLRQFRPGDGQVAGVVLAGSSAVELPSRLLRRKALMTSVFVVVLAACAEAALTYREIAETFSLTTGIDPWMVAAIASFLVGLAFDQLYPPDEDE